MFPLYLIIASVSGRVMCVAWPLPISPAFANSLPVTCGCVEFIKPFPGSLTFRFSPATFLDHLPVYVFVFLWFRGFLAFVFCLGLGGGVPAKSATSDSSHWWPSLSHIYWQVHLALVSHLPPKSGDCLCNRSRTDHFRTCPNLTIIPTKPGIRRVRAGLGNNAPDSCFSYLGLSVFHE